MEFNLLNMCVTVCALILLANSAIAKSSIATTENSAKNETSKVVDSQNQTQSISRRQDGGFDIVSYFLNGNPIARQTKPEQQQQTYQTQQPAASVQHLTIQQQHQLQQHLLQQQQQQQQDQLRQLQLQQLQQIQHPRAVDPNYQNNLVQQYQPQQYQQNQNIPASREGGIGIQLGLGNGYQSNGIGIGNGYQSGGSYVGPEAKEIGINIGAGKPITTIGNLISVLPRIFKVLSAGGKVMFGVELGNNFYFGPLVQNP